MRRNTLVAAASLAMCLALLAVGCGGKKDKGCTTRDDCASGQVCDDGECVDGDCVEDSDCAPRVCVDHQCVDCRTAAECDDQISCTTDSCSSSGACVHTPNDADCDDSIACTVDSCDATAGCQNTPDDSACDDSVPCTADSCSATAGCQNTPDDSACDDSVGCTVDTCDATAGCQHTPSDALCNDNVACTTDTCDAENDCQHLPVDSACNDNWDCTVDSCHPVNGCEHTPNHTYCADAVDCTDDLCDPEASSPDSRGCTITPNDANCSARECNTVTCDITGGCIYTPVPNFDPCSGGGVCYHGACITSSTTVLTPPSSACTMSAWSPKEAIWNGTAGLSVLWDYTTSLVLGCGSPQPYTQIMTVDTTTGAMSGLGNRAWGRGADLLGNIVVGYEESMSTRLTGVVDWAGSAVDWSSANWLATALTSLGSTHRFYTLALHSEGSVGALTQHYWLQASSQVVRCTYVPGPCYPSCPAPQCSLHSAGVDLSWGELAPYTTYSSLNTVYAGVLTTSTPTSGTTRNIWCDGTNKDYGFSNTVFSSTTSAWRGIARYAPSSFLVYGTGSGHNLVQCTDTENDGLATCAALSGLPNQADTSFIDGTAGYSGGAVLLAARCAMDPCFTSAFSLYVLPAGANPAVPGDWVVLPLGTASSLAGPTQVVSAPYAFHAVGKDGSDAPALWSWAPEAPRPCRPALMGETPRA